MRQKMGDSMIQSALYRLPKQRRKCHERGCVDMRMAGHMHTGADRSIEHPSRNLKATVRTRPGQATAKNNAVRLLQRLVNTDPKAKPRMPWIQQFSKLSSVGVLKPCCITRFTRTLD